MSTDETEWNEFTKQIASAASLWQSVDVRAVAIRISGEWHNLFTRCLLDERHPSDVSLVRHLPAGASLQSLQRVFPIDDLDALAVVLRDGQIQYDECDVAYKALGQEKSFAKPYWHQDARFYMASDFRQGLDNALGYAPAFEHSFERFSAHGATLHDLFALAGSDLQALDNELRILEKPTDGLKGLLHTFLGMDGSVSTQQSSLFEVVGPYEAELVPERCTLSDSSLRAIVIARSERIIDHLGLGLIMRGTKTGDGSSAIKLRDESWEQIESNHFECDIQIERAGASSANLLLRTASRCIYRLPLINKATDSNTRIRAYAAFDGDLEELRTGLEPGGPRRASEFESSIARLFHFLGFSVDAFGGLGKKLDSVDALAFSHSPPVCLAIECTTGSESPRVCRRLQTLRTWSYEQIKQIFPGSA